MEYEEHICCEYCECEYKIRYTTGIEDVISGDSRFCPFCGEEHSDNAEEEKEEASDDD